MASDVSGSERLQTPVVVVGGGVSGCACAAALAAQGVGVTLVHPALDRLGEPSFGPIVVGGANGVVSSGWLEGLPEPLGQVWRNAAMVSKDGSVMVVDRRLVGLRTKVELERIEGLELRQGLVVKVTCSQPDSAAGETGREAIRVETAFGESLAADAVVVAVGLGLGEPGEGRWLPPSGGLRESLAALGAEMNPACAEVGPSFGGEVEFGDLEKLSVMRLREDAGDWAGDWGEGSPASPYEVAGLWREEVLMEKGEAGRDAVLVSPDGVATGEVALTAGRVLERQGSVLASRPAYVMRGLAITNVDDSGRLSGGGAPPVWVTGRAAGSGGYVESLLAGVRTAAAVVEAIGRSATGCGEVVGG